MKLRAATRSSPLARWQTDHVSRLLRNLDPSVVVEAVLVDTEGDRRLDRPISELGGKGVFAKEVQQAVLDGRADVAVHSAKDLPSTTVEGLALAAVPERGDPLDALVGCRLDELRHGAQVATGSARRRVQLAAHRPDLEFHELRGNMATRWAKSERFDAIVVAAVAFERLGWSDRLAERLGLDVMLPQVAQGALAVECRTGDADVRALLKGIEHTPSRVRVDAERGFLAELGGDCELPAGAHAVHLREDLAPQAGTTAAAGRLRLEAMLAAPDGATILRCQKEGPVAEAEELGRRAARELAGS